MGEALAVIRATLVEPTAVIWRTLLGRADVHRDVVMGELATRDVLRREPRHNGDHVVLSNIYASAGRWEGVARARAGT